MAESTGPKKIAFIPELQGSAAMGALIDRIRALAANNQFPNALSALDESLEHRGRIADGFAASSFSTDFENLPEDADLGGFLYRFTPRDRT
ncbi:hypothetical protein [Agrobacterium tumefaciens]|uniref:hypothetical protein n=1 Tax=Agrobacterium tumefaciens TaxID=358 RepID=UPI0015744EEC|nr:hypothetical protein [Agrobacterium tumefaciens]NSX94392.1 hypothetical protein [Agrobacterium tumefaciens]